MTRSLPGWLAPLVFMAWHVIFCLTCFVFAWLMWQHFWLNTIFVLIMIFVSAWNGGNYYFEVFVHRYLNEVGLPAKDPPLARSQSAGPERVLGVESASDAAAVRNVVRASSESALNSDEATWANPVEATWEMLDGSDFQRPPNGSTSNGEGETLRHRAAADAATSSADELRS
eukprot:jgi/Ulvmu1/1516/UM011_0246.1